MGGEGSSSVVCHTNSEQKNIVPHARTLRNAREQVKQMVNDGVSLHRIKSYLRRWCSWWVRSSQSWQYQELLGWFLHVCRDSKVVQITIALLQESNTPTLIDLQAGLDFHATA